jgi:23S rRNA U2552 (ribose-2'-O)-methylase RlmE/FtsJ
MLPNRKKAFDNISRVLAITRLDIEHHQAIGDLSLNIHSENYFRDVFNFVYGKDFDNNNYVHKNAPFIDLIDHKNKEIIQITTTRTKEKILHSLKALTKPEYKGYKFSIYYLLSKAMPNSSTTDEIELTNNVILSDVLRDSTDLIRDIEHLKTNRLIELSTELFEPFEVKYTNEMVLDLVFKKLVKEKSTLIFSYDDDIGGISPDNKIIINKLNDRVTNKIRASLDYTTIIDSIDDGDLIIELQVLVVNKLYKNILVEQLKTKEKKEKLIICDVNELHLLAKIHDLNFSKVIHNLSENLQGLVTIKDFNSMDISWILVSYFFEICDVGIKK